MLGLSSNQNHLTIPKFLLLTLNLSLRLKKTVLRSDLAILKISKRLLMPNGNLSMTSLIKSLQLELKLSFLDSLLVTWQLNTLLTRIFSVLDVYLRMISKEFAKLLVLLSRRQQMESPMLYWENVENLKKNSLEMIDSTTLLNALIPKLLLW